MLLIPLAGEHAVVNELFMPAYVFGIIAFVILMTMLLIVMGVGKDRPHSQGGPSRGEATHH